MDTLLGPVHRSQGYGRVPTADEEIAMRATPEPERASHKDRWIGRQCSQGGSEPVVLDGVTPVQGVWENQTQGEAAIRSPEMASQPGMRGRDRQVFDNLGPVEGQFLSP